MVFDFLPSHFVPYYKKVINVKFGHDYCNPFMCHIWLEGFQNKIDISFFKINLKILHILNIIYIIY